jgi:hypothetical protein
MHFEEKTAIEQRKELLSNILQAINTAYTIELGRIHFYNSMVVDVLKSQLDQCTNLLKQIS